MNKSHWDRLYQGGPLQEPESVRHEQIAAGVRDQLTEVDGPILLLGVNPALSGIDADITAVDRNLAVVRARWLGNIPSRRAIVADWRQLPFLGSSFAACMGDGSPNCVQYPEAVRSLYDNVLRVLRPGGKFVCRMYLTPDAGETVADVMQAAWQGGCRSFLYFKFRLAMAIAAQQSDPSVSVRAIHAAFSAHCSDRDRLSEISGWTRSEIDKIDLYESSSELYNFPTRGQCVAVIPPGFVNVRFVAVGSYELAERCPLLVMEKA
jgi:SAM-dependent methyltransferase